jgi:t-SNARE complex subunit (syntaxin)
MPFDQDENDGGYQYAQPQDLQQEAVLLKASLENDLDEVQQMETTMVHITTLLSQFADLVAGQQEDIVQIHEAVSSTKDNLEKGQENLVDAAGRAQQSRHYMATAITAMAMMLLFVHWIRP